MLNTKVAIYVPSTIAGNKPAPKNLIKKWENNCKEKMAQLFGGFTVFKTKGGWYSPELGLIEENITIIQSFTNEEGLNKVPELQELAKNMAEAMSQEVVAVEIAGVMNFIPA